MQKEERNFLFGSSIFTTRKLLIRDEKIHFRFAKIVLDDSKIEIFFISKNCVANSLSRKKII